MFCFLLFACLFVCFFFVFLSFPSFFFPLFNRPEQHGAELLSPLSSILTTATDAQGAAPSALALEGLYYLCEAQVRALASFLGFPSNCRVYTHCSVHCAKLRVSRSKVSSLLLWRWCSGAVCSGLYSGSYNDNIQHTND